MFIAEDVPELVATGDRRGLSSMDVVAVLGVKPFIGALPRSRHPPANAEAPGISRVEEDDP